MSSTERLHDAISSRLSEYAPPVDLAPGRTFYAAHLLEPAVLKLGEEYAVIHPTVTADSMSEAASQDYQIISPSGLLRIMVTMPFDSHDVRGLLDRVDTESEETRGLPSGIAIVRPGEEARLGTASTPQLWFGDTVGQKHAQVKVSDKGLTISDFNTGRSTALYLTASDFARPRVVEPLPSIDPGLRRAIISQIGTALLEGDIEIISEELIVEGETESLHEGRLAAHALSIMRAHKFSSLQPPEGYDLTKVLVVPELGEVSVARIPSWLERAPGIFKSIVRTMATTEEASQILQLAHQL